MATFLNLLQNMSMDNNFLENVLMWVFNMCSLQETPNFINGIFSDFIDQNN